MPQVFVTKNFVKLGQAFDAGYTTVSEQGSARSSKTYSNVQWLIVRCLNHPGTTVSIVRKTLNALKRSVYRDFEGIMKDWGLWSDREMNKSEYVYRFPNGSWIEFFSCDNEQKMRGPKRQILFVNEANDLNYIEWQQLQMRTTMFTILDYNPSFSEEHWINLVNEEKKTFHFISTYKDNPFLEQKIIDEIESLQHKNKSLWQIYGLGQRAIVEGLVFPNMKIVDYVPREAERRRYVGVDFGYENDQTAIVEVSFYRNQMFIQELCYRTHMLTSDIIRELKKIEWEPEIISESADPRLVDEIYNAGLDIHAVHKFGGSISAGITKMQEYEICVTRESENAIKELRNYTYRQDKEGKWLNEPIDAYNHCFTGDTLVATTVGCRRIDSLRRGDAVLTSRGVHAVTWFFRQGRRKVWHVRFVFKDYVFKTVSATPDHRFKTKAGWKRLDGIDAGDILYRLRPGESSSPLADYAEEAELVGLAVIGESVEDTYDIEVEGAHEFFANGVLAHNCIDAARYVVLEKILGVSASGMSASEILGIVG